MNDFKQQQLAEIRVREARRAGAQTQLAQLAPSRFRVWRWRAFGEWMLGGLTLLGLFVWFLLTKAAQRITKPIKAMRTRADMRALAEAFQQTER